MNFRIYASPQVVDFSHLSWQLLLKATEYAWTASYERHMRMILVSLLSLGLILSACSPNSDARDAAAKLKRETDGAARKAGRAAFQLTRETKEAAAKAERKLKDAGRDAKAGWDDAKHKAEAEEGK